MSELQEFTAGTNPNVVDSDGDGLSDFQESITLSTNPNLVDTDGDGFEDGEEIAAGLSALDASVYPGWDFVPENLETPLFTHLSAGGPVSGGGLNSFSSVGLFVSPAIISDTGFSSLHGFLFLANPPTGDPRDADADGDGMTDVWERTMGTRVTVADADDDDDGDGLSNLGEFSEGTNPKNADSDGDGLSDGAEKNVHGSNPLLADSDEDGYTDDAEVAEGSSPNDSDSIPPSAILPVFSSAPMEFSSAGNYAQGGGLKTHFLAGAGISVGIGINTNMLNLHGFYFRSHTPVGNPGESDTDGDAMPDVWESLHGLDTTLDDSLTDLDEMDWLTEWNGAIPHRLGFRTQMGMGCRMGRRLECMDLIQIPWMEMGMVIPMRMKWSRVRIPQIRRFIRDMTYQFSLERFDN